jgi:hypothetical protein
MDTTPGRDEEIKEKNDSAEASSLMPSKPGSVETTSSRYSVLIPTKKINKKIQNNATFATNCP